MEIKDKRNMTAYGRLNSLDAGECFMRFDDSDIETDLWMLTDQQDCNEMYDVVCLETGEICREKSRLKVIPVNAHAIIEDDD